MRTALALFAALLSLLLIAGSASADAPLGDRDPRASRSPFRFGPAREIPILVVGAGTSATWLLHREAECLPHCEPIEVNALDEAFRPAHSSRTWSDLSDVALAAVLLLPHAINIAETWPRDDVWTEDMILTLEAAFLAQGLSQVVKTSVSRRAPVVFDPLASEHRRTTPDATKSFWSAHTAAAVAAATSFSLAYALRHPSSPWRWLVLVGLETAALTVGALTVAAGDHYATDVLAGAGAGALVGVTIPLFHTSPALGGFSP